MRSLTCALNEAQGVARGAICVQPALRKQVPRHDAPADGVGQVDLGGAARLWDSAIFGEHNHQTTF